MVTPIEMLRRQLNLATHRIHTLPMLVLMPFGGCNCRCQMCDIWRGNREARAISREDLARHLEGLRRLRVRRVVLSGGEALMHLDLWRLCEMLKAAGIEITLLSNGLLLERHAAEIVRWCDEVTVSLDGPREVHDAIRGVPHAYDRLAQGVAALKSSRRGGPVWPPLGPVWPPLSPWRAGRPRVGARSLRVTARCVIQRRNYSRLPDIIRAAHEIGLDRLSFLAVDVATGAFNRPAGWEPGRVGEVALSPDEVSEFGRIVEEVLLDHADDFASGFVAEDPEKLRRLPAYFSAVNRHRDFPRVVCNAPWVSAVVEADGVVRPCFFHRPLGSLHDRPLEAILNSAEAVAFRRGLDVGRDAICRRCVCTLQLGLRAGV